jgi:hypothetical protein
MCQALSKNRKTRCPCGAQDIYVKSFGLLGIFIYVTVGVQRAAKDANCAGDESDEIEPHRSRPGTEQARRSAHTRR